jgi:PAS domain S-box-containing protein
MERLFHSLFRTSDGAFVIDRDYRIIFWNRAAEQLLGFTAGEVLGRQCYEILGGRDEQGRTLCQRFCLAAIQAEKDAVMPNQDVYVMTKGDAGCWLNVTTFAYPVADKSIAKIIVHLFRDVTEQRNYQRFADRVLAASKRLQRNEARHIIPASPTDSRLDRLTPRERQVLELLAQGLGTNEIAGSLAISASTVRNHVQNILGKLEVHSRLEAIAYAYQEGPKRQ